MEFHNLFWICNTGYVSLDTLNSCFFSGKNYVLMLQRCLSFGYFYNIALFFPDSSAILHDEQAKKPCRKFLQKGNKISQPYTNPVTKPIFQTSVSNQLFFSFSFSIGICDFGPNCRFSHMSEADLFNLQRQVEGKPQPYGSAVYSVTEF